MVSMVYDFYFPESSFITHEMQKYFTFPKPWHLILKNKSQTNSYGNNF